MTLWLWAGFLLLILVLLAIDLGWLNRTPHVVKTREALIWTAIWIALALLFNIGVYFMYEHHWLGIGLGGSATVGGRAAAIEFLTGYLIEKSLSLDNIFVIALIFTFFKVPPKYQHRVLFWGILGALALRLVMIAAGAALITRLDWMVYVFGGFLIFTAFKMMFAGHHQMDPGNHWLVRMTRRFMPMTDDYREDRFFVRVDGVRKATPMFLVLLVIESSDVMFAVDSIPAIFAVTRDPFLVFTSNIFAILGLRSLYFALASLMDKFRYLKVSLVVLLAFVGVKMLLAHHYPIPSPISLAVIAAILSAGIAASLWRPIQPTDSASSSS